MKPTPLLDFWDQPAEAGEPVALLATTYALEPDFFEQNCLARFLEVSSVNEESGSVDDIVAAVELQESLRKTSVTVLADRSAPVQRTSLLWDLLSCKVNGGLLHSKVAVLLWENATRIILGSANLTAAGYRRQIELGLAVDFGKQCLFPQNVLMGIADELGSYLGLVPGYDAKAAVFARARSTLQLLRERIAAQTNQPAGVRVAFAPTNQKAAPLGKLEAVWRGAKPLRATHLSPFWDSKDPLALTETGKLLTGGTKDKRSQRVAVVPNPRGQVDFSECLTSTVKSVHRLKDIDSELRTLHAKCLLIESDEWVAALVGSSNHTKAGLGLGKGARHREMNVWLGAPFNSKEGAALRRLIELGDKISHDTEVIEPKDEDETELLAVPSCFGLCQIVRVDKSSPWELQLGILETSDMPCDWEISLAIGLPPFLTRARWEESGKSEKMVTPLPPQVLPMFVFVVWAGNASPWAVVADNPHVLPAGATLSSLRAEHLLHALARGRPLSEVLRAVLEKQQASAGMKGGIILDPLRRFEVEGSLLRKGRALAASLATMQHRLERPVLTLDALQGRLASPLGPEFVATKVAEAYEAGYQSGAEAIFTIAEIALTLGRVNWANVLAQVDRVQGTRQVDEALSRLNLLRNRVSSKVADLSSYADRAIKEARQCIAR